MKDIIVQKKLFGDLIEISVEKQRGKNNLHDIIENAYEKGLFFEKIFNVYDPESEISLLNKHRTRKMPEEFIELLKQSLLLCKKTGGAYDVSLGEEFLKRKSGKEESKPEYSYKDIEISKDSVSLKKDNLLIDLGSVAKGYITDKMIEHLLELGASNGYINARGDIRVFGEKELLIDIQHPRNKEKHVISLLLKDSAIATSGDYEQYIKDFDHSHILHGKDFVSVSVIAPTLAEADLYSTALFVSSQNETSKIAKTISSFKILVIDKDLKAHEYNNIHELFVEVKKNSSKVREADIENYFAPEDLHSDKAEPSTNDSEDSAEWFIDEGPIEEHIRTVFVRANREEAEVISKAS